ncbi:MAG: hypothetical protein JXM70_16470 [Pirellulales bacterium]|nr:hypothetical protein [Pirellulales bacterium]
MTITDESQKTAMCPWRLIGWLCAGLITASILACVVMAAIRSTGLTKITVTALDAASEPRDHALPLIKQKEALPDYELSLILTNGDKVSLGAKPDTSAVDGLAWHVNDPVSIVDVASVRLYEQDKVISDAVAEVQILGNSISENGYRFDFASERSMSVGVKSFFATPIGKAITTGFCIAIVLMLISVFRV